LQKPDFHTPSQLAASESTTEDSCSNASAVFQAGDYIFPLGRKTYVMGILNVTPDSFSDGGCFLSLDNAMRQTEKMIKDGVDVIDVGGESTRPGFLAVSESEEMERVVPVIEKICSRFLIPVSIDTRKAKTAAAAIQAGAVIVNDITGLREDSEMAGAIAKTKAGVILMHYAGLSTDLLTASEKRLDQSDWQSRMLCYLHESIQRATDSGIARTRLMTDPGIGFNMTPEMSIEVLRQIGYLKSLGLPILIGVSKKRLISHILGGRLVHERLMGTAAAVCFAIMNGADFVRVHDVAEIADAVRVMDTLYRERSL
jgi:dihydropteroate synthase